MSEPPRIRRLRESEWRAFRDLRLRSLRAEPRAFGSTSAREESYPEARWRDWTRRGATSETEGTFVATGSDGRWAGMCGGFSKEGEFHIWGLWVDPSWRGQGIGRALLDAVLAWIDGSSSGALVILDVNPEMSAAVRTYRSRGFTFTGVEAPLGHHPPAIVKRMTRESGR